MTANAKPTVDRVSFKTLWADAAEVGGDLFDNGDSSGPALLLVPDVHGISPLYRSMGARLAASGFATLVFDLYRREGIPRLADLEQINRWIEALPDERVLADLGAGLAFLSKRGHARSGILGFCLGGQYALMAACRQPAPAACASFYGMLRYTRYSDRKPRSALDMAPDLRCPFLGLYGANDPLIPRSDVEALRQVLQRSDKSFDIVVYEGAGHAFLNETRPEAYRPEAAQDAWDRALSFFRKTLSPESA